MDKNKNSLLMGIAEKTLGEQDCPLFIKDSNHTSIYKSYNGQIAALGVSILMIGLKATVSVYYQGKYKDNDAYRRALLEVIAKMLNEMGSGYNFKNAYSLTHHIVGKADEELSAIKTDILDCSIALKQVIRTYKLD